MTAVKELGRSFVVPEYQDRIMAALRKKLEKNGDQTQYIQTHIGVGYRMLKVE